MPASITSLPLEHLATDAVVLGSAQGAAPDRRFDDLTGGLLSRLFGSQDFKGKAGECVVLYPEGLGSARLALVGLGETDKIDAETVRRAAGTAATRLGNLGCRRIAFGALGTPTLSVEASAFAIVEGAGLASYRLDDYRTIGLDEIKQLGSFEIAVPAKSRKVAEKALAEAVLLVKAVAWVRDLVGYPGNTLTAERMAEEAEQMARKSGIHFQAFGRKELEKLGFGALLGVNSGSRAQPRCIVLEYRGAAGKPVALVGKGITFDTGGISIKGADGMDRMKDDMAGGGAVLGTLRAAADLRLPVNLVGIVPATDNMPGSASIKPGDVVTTTLGKTIEVINTDAEGRLVLADALGYANKTYDPSAIIDLATLTGSIIVGLGHHATGLYATDDTLAERLTAAGERAAERVWRMPLWPEHDELIESDIADMKNQPDRRGDAVAAAALLKQFVGERPWAHLDIAGTSWAESDEPYKPKGPTGVGVRLLVEALRAGL